jgi:hypothetical protein
MAAMLAATAIWMAVVLSPIFRYPANYCWWQGSRGWRSVASDADGIAERIV